MKLIKVLWCWIMFTCTFNLHAADLKQSLILALHQDQQHRGEINRLKQQAENAALIEQLESAQHHLDQQNLNTLDQIITQLGRWPGVHDVGENAARIAMLLFKRSTLEQQASYLPMLHQAVKNQDIPPIWYAESFDHHLMLQDLPQRYGQLNMQAVGSHSKELYPITSFQAVNQNRSDIGLPPLQTALGEQNLLLRDNLAQPDEPIVLDADHLMQVAELALTCLDQVYPNKIAHVLNAASDAAPPDQLYPAFFGCFDWHSAVHGHWLLVRAAKLFPKHPKSSNMMQRLAAHFTAEKMAAELAYFQQPGRAGFERPYGLAWYLQLYAELADWQHPQAKQWLEHLTPLKNHVVQQLSGWIPKLAYPIRTGEHSQTAFAFGLAYDYAVTTGDLAFKNLLTTHIKRLYLKDQDCPINYEPSGHDFLSPCLAEADLMRRVLAPKTYSRWLKKFLPGIHHGTRWLPVAQVTDRVDGKLAHLDGLNLARAWMLEGMASALPVKDKRRSQLARLADIHAESGLAAVTGEHYSGGHWLGSFATYYLTQRGINNTP